MGKVLGPMLGYGADCDEFHQEAAKAEQERQLEIEKENCQLPTSWEPFWGNDLWLWSSLAAKKHVTEGPHSETPMAGGNRFPPPPPAPADGYNICRLCFGLLEPRDAKVCFRILHRSTSSMNGVCRVDQHEWTFPLHAWVEDEAKKLLRSRLKLPNIFIYIHICLIYHLIHLYIIPFCTTKCLL